VILTLSRLAVDALKSARIVEISIDLKPALDINKLDNRLLREINNNLNQKISFLLRALMPLQLIQTCVQECKLDPEKKCNRFDLKERKKLLNWLKDFRINITGNGSFDEAIITAGGINLKEINPKTMESKIVKNLFFAGEILDLNADTGGYNLQIAFSTGWVAGNSASEKNNKTI
jgi:predicted Rossmann fold flavoprotein